MKKLTKNLFYFLTLNKCLIRHPELKVSLICCVLNLSQCVEEAPLQSDVPVLTEEPAQYITTMQIDGEFNCFVVQQRTSRSMNEEYLS